MSDPEISVERTATGGLVIRNNSEHERFICMTQSGDEDTTQIDRELIANDLDTVAKLAGRLGYPDMATEIGALVAKYRRPLNAPQAVPDPE